MPWFDGLEAICRTDVPLSEHTWYGLGGPASWLLTPRNEAELCEVLRRCAENHVPWRILGRGANVLVRDEGFDGAVIMLDGPAWEQISFDDPPRVRAGAGADFPRLVRETVQRGLAGLESLAGIPGTVGGAVRMNAGGTHGSVSDHVTSVRLVQPDGRAYDRPAAAIHFGYRSTRLDGAIIAAATFELKPDNDDTAPQRYRAIWNEKYSTQPPVSARSAGCIFKNPPGHAAGKLIDNLGMKGERSGGAEISPQHANFILAHEGARARDVLDLIQRARERVRQHTGVSLELEIEIW